MPSIKSSRSIRSALNAILFVLAVGTCGYMWIEGWDFWKALFFTVITLTTVGYSDYGISEAGARFTAVLLVAGVAVMTFSLSHVGPLLFNEKIIQERAMKRKMRGLSDHFIICGLGRVGRACCACLAQRSATFVCIDTSESAVAWAREQGYVALEGDATRDEVLEEAGVRWAKGLAAVTKSDTENIVITLGARQANPELQIISRAEEVGASQKAQRAGATRVISPIHAGGESIANTLVNPIVADLVDTAGEVGIEFAELTISEASDLDGMTIRACAEAHEGVVFIALSKRDGRVRVRPEGQMALHAGDVLIAGGDAVTLGRLQDHATEARAAA